MVSCNFRQSGSRTSDPTVSKHPESRICGQLGNFTVNTGFVFVLHSLPECVAMVTYAAPEQVTFEIRDKDVKKELNTCAD